MKENKAYLLGGIVLIGIVGYVYRDRIKSLFTSGKDQGNGLTKTETDLNAGQGGGVSNGNNGGPYYTGPEMAGNNWKECMEKIGNEKTCELYFENPNKPGSSGPTVVYLDQYGKIKSHREGKALNAPLQRAQDVTLQQAQV